MDDSEIPGRIRDIRVYRPSFVGMSILACTAFLIFGAAPAYGVLATVVLTFVWLVLLAVGCISFKPHPRRVLGAGVVSLLAWLLVVLVTH